MKGKPLDIIGYYSTLSAKIISETEKAIEVEWNVSESGLRSYNRRAWLPKSQLKNLKFDGRLNLYTCEIPEWLRRKL